MLNCAKTLGVEARYVNAKEIKRQETFPSRFDIKTPVKLW
jgi:hypothetical protein